MFETNKYRNFKISTPAYEKMVEKSQEVGMSLIDYFDKLMGVERDTPVKETVAKSILKRAKQRMPKPSNEYIDILILEAFKRWASFQKTALARSDIFDQVKNTLVRSDIFDRGSYPKYFTTPRAIDNHVDNRLKALCVANKHRSA